jgi:methylated-DNA-[protein]-cysteine S-methyltransferase
MKPAFVDYAFVFSAPFGKLGIALRGDALCRIDFLGADVALLPPSSAFAREVAEQLSRYFSDPTFRFDLALAIAGTPFQQRIWATLREIPAGSTCRYGELARELHTGPRVVGNACRANPVPIIIPCHRVVGARGLGGYTGTTLGEGLAVKRWLLQHEQRA